MEIVNKNGNIIDVEAYLREIDLWRNFTPAFKLPLTSEKALSLLVRFYEAQVKMRGGNFEADEVTKSHLRIFSEAVTASNGSGGIMLCGNCGNGKTTLLYAFQRMLNWLGDINALPELEKAYGEKPGIVIKDAKKIAALSSDAAELDRIMKLNMLAIEDMGKEPSEVVNYGNIIAPIQDIIEYRYDKRLFTFITTNLTPKTITSRYGKRIGDRLCEMLKIIVFENESYRSTQN